MTPPLLTEEECLKIGGHCFEMSNVVLATNPPMYQRQCKHCGRVEVGRQQNPIVWAGRGTSSTSINL